MARGLGRARAHSSPDSPQSPARLVPLSFDPTKLIAVTESWKFRKERLTKGANEKVSYGFNRRTACFNF